MKLKISEKDLQSEAIKTLKHFDNIYVIRNNNFVGKIMRPNRTSGWINNSTNKGSPDLILLKNGFYIGVEFKSTDATQSKDQKKAENFIRRCGGHYFLVKTIQEFDKIIECF